MDLISILGIVFVAVIYLLIAGSYWYKLALECDNEASYYQALLWPITAIMTLGAVIAMKTHMKRSE